MMLRNLAESFRGRGDTSYVMTRPDEGMRQDANEATREESDTRAGVYSTYFIVSISEWHCTYGFEFRGSRSKSE